MFCRITFILNQEGKQFEAVRKDPYFNALQIKFAYAVTCHKAQGGQWERVFIDQGMFNRNEISIDYLALVLYSFNKVN